MGIDITPFLRELGSIKKENRMQMAVISSDIFDAKRISKALVEQAEEDLRCPDNRQYVSMRGVIKVKSKVQTQW